MVSPKPPKAPASPIGEDLPGYLRPSWPAPSPDCSDIPVSSGSLVPVPSGYATLSEQAGSSEYTFSVPPDWYESSTAKDIPSKPRSLDGILGFLTVSKSSVAQLLESEVAALTKVLTTLNDQLERRRCLEKEALCDLEYQELYLSTRMLNLRPSHFPYDARIHTELEKEFIGVRRQRIQTREAAARDIFDIQKLAVQFLMALHQNDSLGGFVQ